jgi:epoxyqueuosine reductase
MLFPAQTLKQQAAALGFNLVGIVEAKPSPYLAAYLRWIEAGMHGSMGYMARPDRVERRRDLNVILPGVRSLIMVGLDYGASVPDAILNDPARGRIASYAWGGDYHDVMTPKLEQLADWLARERGEATKHRVYVDTGAILERSHAQAAGLGFVGKNTMLIHPRRGSLFFLGEILTDAEFDQYDQPFAKATMCGSCTRCLNACPTNAFPAPHVLDARRCISALTIEHKGWIDRDLRPLMGNWIYGCDVCQEVCPFQRFAPGTSENAFVPIDFDRAAPPLLDVLALNEAGFVIQFAGSAITRIKRERLVRNACIAAGNWGAPQAIPPLLRLLDDASPLVRGHAAWALGRIGGAAAALAARLEIETDENVRGELKWAIDAQIC